MIDSEEKKRILSFEERIDPASTALIIVDVQNDFASPQGVCGKVGDDVSAVPAMVGRLVRLIESARNAGVLIIYLRTIYGQRGTEHRLVVDRAKIDDQHTGVPSRFNKTNESANHRGNG